MSRDLGKSPSQPPDVARDDDAMLGEDATYLIHELRAASHQALAYPMEGLDRQLFGGLRRNKTHRGSADRLADSFCIIPIIFVRLHIRRHKLRAYQAHLVTELRKHTCPRTVRSFHPDQARRQIGKKRRHRSTTQGFTNDSIPLPVNAMNFKHVLCQVQAYPNDLHDDSPSLQFTSDIRPAGRAGVHTIGAALARTFWPSCSIGRVRSCVRPVCAAVKPLAIMLCADRLALSLALASHEAHRSVFLSFSLWRC